jgi:prepilin-type N-terminal cleavage/methylation domain-containing protein
MRNKKGFTLVELIVVIAIIGIMTSVAVPNIVRSNRRSEDLRHNAQARSFYLAVHQVLTNTMQNDNSELEFGIHIPAGATNITRRMTTGGTGATPIRPIVSINDGRHFFLYVEVDGGGNVTHADLVFATPADYVAMSDAAARTAALAQFDPTADRAAMTDPNERIFARFMDEVAGYSDLSSQVGSYYAMFDTQFRVIMAFYSQFADRAEARRGAGTEDYRFTTNNRIGPRNSSFGAFPRHYGYTGAMGAGDGIGAINRGSNPQWFVDIIPGL